MTNSVNHVCVNDRIQTNIFNKANDFNAKKTSKQDKQRSVVFVFMGICVNVYENMRVYEILFEIYKYKRVQRTHAIMPIRNECHSTIINRFA